MRGRWSRHPSAAPLRDDAARQRVDHEDVELRLVHVAQGRGTLLRPDPVRSRPPCAPGRRHQLRRGARPGQAIELDDQRRQR